MNISRENPKEKKGSTTNNLNIPKMSIANDKSNRLIPAHQNKTEKSHKNSSNKIHKNGN